MRARRLTAVALAFAVSVAAFSATRGDERAAAGPPRPGPTVNAAALAASYLQRVRETGDASYYDRAGHLLRTALARHPHDQPTLVQAAALAAARHDFRGALGLARRAQAALPGTLAPLPVEVDALVELGRYAEAERTLQRLVDLKPTLASYARVSYFRELTGDGPGAVAAMRRAVAAGGPVPENVAYVQSLLGGLELGRGRPAAARRAFDAALAAMPAYAPAAAGRARLAAADGHLGDAIACWRRIVARLPLPEYVIALGETELAAGRHEAARRDLALVRTERRLLAAAGVNTDVELAIFEADHGSHRRALALARAAWATAPSIRAADALGWALTRAGRPRGGVRWAQRALKLGSLDPGLRYHAGIAELATGRRAAGRRDLRLAIAHGLATQPLHLRRAQEALR